jgi:Arc/MetJ family transcription regulator
MLYFLRMTRRTTLDVDDALLGQAQKALGTTGLKETVDAALREVTRRSLRARLAERIATGHGVDRSLEMLDQVRPER